MRLLDVLCGLLLLPLVLFLALILFVWGAE